ncbi:metal ABC transporter substrate-binding protein [Paenibacillus sedimenti]|uniref:Zinc ABC transporter substrate-binding protein n=1 Tax=Paenibacillus sedimenti TaxID=2770274 RepID=A0A926KRY9_9BACL|nr:metal ABC transporter substrate-binding protein [Paenibacillus sedimenti]MBD0382984.1 zinc ABC transporter substrate-binding protein [Paenibacillus sedimenti]
MKTWIHKTLAFTAVSALIISGCSAKTTTETSASAAPTAQANQESGKKLKVVTTFYPMYEFSKQIAGEHAEVIGLVPTGVEPHDWEPSAKDMAQLKEADVFVYNGIVEGWVPKALESAANSKRVVVEASKAVELMEGLHEEDEHGHGKEEKEHKDEHEEEGLDPHVWLDPVLAQKEVAAIQAALVQADPAHKDAYTKNADAYIAKLKELDDLFRSGLKDVKRKDFITQHAAFAYLAKQYGLTQVPISGLSPEAEPAPDKMAEVIKFAKEKTVKTIFFETLVDPKIASTIAKEIGAKTEVLNPLEGLTDEEKKNNLDYIGVMKKNLEALKKGLNE